MPGTLAVICDGRIRVHVLDRGGPFWHELQTLERHVGAVFGLRFAAPSEQSTVVGADLQNASQTNAPADERANDPANAPANRQQQLAPDDR